MGHESLAAWPGARQGGDRTLEKVSSPGLRPPTLCFSSTAHSKSSDGFVREVESVLLLSMQGNIVLQQKAESVCTGYSLIRPTE